jgi:hypothetical protein
MFCEQSSAMDCEKPQVNSVSQFRSCLHLSNVELRQAAHPLLLNNSTGGGLHEASM